MAMNPRNEVVIEFLAAAEKLDHAAAHCRIAAEHFKGREIPRGCAHAFAAIGDIAAASAAISRNAETHAHLAEIVEDSGYNAGGSE